MPDSIRSIRQSAALFFSGTALSRLSGLIRDVVMAFAFGTDTSVAAFLMAFRFAHLLRRLFGEGAMPTALIPLFERLKSESPERAGRFMRDLMKGLSLFLIIIIACTMGGLYPIYHRSEVLWLTFLMLPSLLFICLFGVNAAFLQCHRCYFTPSVAPVLFNGVWILTVLFRATTPSETAMTSLALGIIVACVAQMSLTSFRLRTLLKKTYPIKSRFSWNSTDLKLLFRPLLFVCLAGASTQINNALDVLFARLAEPEGPAYLWYALRLQQLPFALFGMALSSALLPPLTRSAKAQNEKQFQQFLTFALSSTVTFMLPITVGIFLLGDSYVHVLYQRGDFNSVSTIATTKCLWAYALGLIPMTGVIILNQAFYARQEYRIPIKASVYAMWLNVSLNTLLIFILNQGATSVALATSVSTWCQSYYLLNSLKKKLKFQLPNVKRPLLITASGVLLFYLGTKYPLPWSITGEIEWFQNLTFPHKCLHLTLLTAIYTAPTLTLASKDLLQRQRSLRYFSLK